MKRIFTLRHLQAFIAAALLFLPALLPALTTIEPYLCGEVKIYPIQENGNNFTRELFPQDAETQAKLKASFPREYTEGSINAFLLFIDKKWVLIDTGVVTKESAINTVLNDLRLNNLHVEKIYVTHNHPDHIGNLVDAYGRARFPNATVYFSEEELTAARLRSSDPDPDMMNIMKAYSHRVETFTNGQEVLPGLKAIMAPGHTPGHTIFLLNDKICFCGALLHAHKWQFPNPEVCTIFDANPAEATVTRIKFMTMAAERNWILASAHLPYPGFCFIRKDDRVKDKPAFRFISIRTRKF